MAKTDSLDDLLRSTRMHYGHIQLFRDDQGWQASVYHYEPKRLTHDGRVMDDPVAALRAALLEDARRTKDLERRYAGSVKLGDAERAQKVRDAVAAMSGDDEFEGIFE